MVKKIIKKILTTKIANTLGSLLLPQYSKKFNKIMAFSEAQKRVVKPTSRPVKATVSLSNCCNFMCPICSVHNMQRHGVIRVKNNITLEQIKAMDSILEKIKGINFMGHIGESILNPQFKEIISYLKLKHKLELGISTNGLGLDEKIQETMLKIGFNSVAFSIHAATAETYKILQAGDYEMVIKNLTSLAQKKIQGQYQKPRISIVYALNKANIDEATKMIDLAKKLKINILNFYHYHDYNHEISDVIFDDLGEANRKIDYLYNYAKEQGVIEILPKKPPYYEKAQPVNQANGLYNEEIKCYLPWTGLQMRSSYSHQDSYYLGCCNVFNIFLFNYQKHIEHYGAVEFEKIWQHPIFQYLRQTVNLDGGKRNPLCAYCKSSQRVFLKAANNEENYRIKLEMIEKFYKGFLEQDKSETPIAGLDILYTEDEELNAMSG
jgi:MoaA/NifB/PqqE/SkfB family radical SAM enzyme